jgi:hypothetical protein
VRQSLAAPTRAAEKASIRRTRKFHSCQRDGFVALRNRHVVDSRFAVNDLAAYDRRFHFHVANGFRFQLEDVFGQDHHVGEFAW